MLQLSDSDRSLFRALRTRNVLEGIEPHRLSTENGIIMVTCPDCDQFPDIFRHAGSVVCCKDETARIHPLSLNGGPILLHPSSPVATSGRSTVLTEDIGDAAQMKQIAAVALCAHAPCGKAYAHQLGLAAVIELLMFGRGYGASALPHLRFYPFLHVDQGGNRKRTYFVSSTRWQQWRQQTGYLGLIH